MAKIIYVLPFIILMSMVGADNAGAQNQTNYQWEWDGTNWVPLTGARNRRIAQQNEFDGRWEYKPSLDDQEKMEALIRECVQERISGVKSNGSARNIAYACNLINNRNLASIPLPSKPYERDQKVIDSNWLSGKCILSKTNGDESDAAASLIASTCQQAAQHPSKIDSLKLCILHGSC